MERTGSGLNRLSGSNTALLGQRAQVAALSKPLPEFRKPNRSDVVAKNRDALARRRAERQNAKTMSDFRARTSAAAIAQVGKENRSAAKPAAAAARTAAPKPAAASKSTARPLSQRETQNLGLAKSNLAISKERLAFAREAKAKAKGPLEKLKATDRINEHQTNIRELNKKITAINARPAPGRPITGADRSGNRNAMPAHHLS